jgi:K+-transporting ATPase ATPase B chain
MTAKPSSTSWLNAPLLRAAALDSLKKFDPRALWKNPVMFVTALGAVATTVVLVRDLAARAPTGFNAQITAWLWFTVLFANFAEAVAEGRGKAQADTLRKSRTHTTARRIRSLPTSGSAPAAEERVSAADLRRDDLVVCEAGDVIPVRAGYWPTRMLERVGEQSGLAA